MRVCWNRQTGTFEGRVFHDVWVQVPSLAPKRNPDTLVSGFLLYIIHFYILSFMSSVEPLHSDILLLLKITCLACRLGGHLCRRRPKEVPLGYRSTDRAGRRDRSPSQGLGRSPNQILTEINNYLEVLI